MVNLPSVKHHIQKHIIDVLTYQKIARFSDLRPAGIDTNLFTYHLGSLVKSGLVKKEADGYSLGAVGLSYIDRVGDEDGSVRTQPKIITMLVVQNGEGDILLERLTKQPFIDTWTLPCEKLRSNDESVAVAATRTVHEKLGLRNQQAEHAGDCYIRVHANGELLSTTLVHVFRLYADDITTGETIAWARPHKLAALDVAPAVEDVMTRAFFKDPFFFEEYDVTL